MDSASMAPLSRQCLDDSLRVVLDHIQQHQRRSVRGAITSLPVPQGCGRKTKTGSKLRLGHPDLGPKGLHVDYAGTVQTHATGITLGMSNCLLQAQLDIFECITHGFVLSFQASTKASTKSANSFRSPLVRLTLSPLAKSVSKY